MTLKNIMKKIDVQTFDQRLGIVGYDNTQISKFRHQCYSSVKYKSIESGRVWRSFNEYI